MIRYSGFVSSGDTFYFVFSMVKLWLVCWLHFTFRLHLYAGVYFEGFLYCMETPRWIAES